MRLCLGVLTVAGGLLLTSPVCAASYYVSPTGSDTSEGSESSPFKTLKKGVSVLAPGDVLLVRAGTYAEELYDDIPGGTSWSNTVTVKAYPGEKPVIQPSAGANRVLSFAKTGSSYIVVDGFVLDAKNVSYDAVKITYGSSGVAHHIRIIRCEVMGSPGQGILITGEDDKLGLDVTGNELIDLDVHDNGLTDFDHGYYISTAKNLIDGGRVHQNAGWGVHVYNGSADNADDNVIRNVRSYDNARVGNRGVGIGIYSGSGTVAYNNLIWGNKIGIALNYAATGAGVFNNVVFDNVDGISVGSEATGATLQNNIVWKNSAGVTDQGSGTTDQANLVGVDPQWVDPTKFDFHLTAASPAIDKGVSVPTVATDLDGIARPQGSGYDIGAFEWCTSGACADGGVGTGGSAGAGGSAGGAGVASGGTAGSGASGGSAAGAGGSATGGSTAGSSSGDDSGCGCRAAGERGRGQGLLALVIGALALHRRRAPVTSAASRRSLRGRLAGAMLDATRASA